MFLDPRLEIILRQIDILAVLLARPIVQRQIIAILLIISLAWAIDHIVATRIYPRIARIRENGSGSSNSSRFFHLLLLGRRLYYPVIGLALIPLGVAIFQGQGWPSGLIQNSAVIFWIILVYRSLLGFLELWVSPGRVEILRKRVMAPMFTIIPTIVFLDQFIDVRGVLNIQVFFFLNTEITLGRILLSFFWLYIFYTLGWLVVEGLQKVILPRTEANSGVANTITTISRYVIVIAGILVIFGTLGLDLTSLALIGTGLTVGIGFGMQQVIANFISGILLLFEQSLRPGDFIEIDNKVGTVQQLNIRSTIIRTVDAEIIVPNEMFLTSQLTTFTKSNMLGRVVVPLGVSYGSDPHEVERILVETAVKHEMVLEDPPPVVFFDNFGASSLDFRLVAWITEPRQRIQVGSELHFMVWDAFKEHNIEIPFPQHDLNLRSGWAELVRTIDSQPNKVASEGNVAHQDP